MNQKAWIWTVAAVTILAVIVAVRSTSPTSAVHRRGSTPKPLVQLTGTVPELRRYIAKREDSKDLRAQDLVGAARIRIGYAAAQKGDWVGARREFQTAASKYRGTNTMSADFGGVPDQAAYQAAVCLVGAHRTKEARAEFVRFMKERPLSPLVHAAFARLTRLNGGIPDPNDEALLQAAVSRQEARIRFETTVCGPKTIEYLLRAGLLPASAGAGRDYKTLAHLCGTSERGTTIAGMVRGLRSIRVPSFPYRLNRQDLASAKMPAILLSDDHYVALLRVEAERAYVYDTQSHQTSQFKLPPLVDPDFSVNAILFSPLSSIQR